MRFIAFVALAAATFASVGWALEGRVLTSAQSKRYDRLTHELIAPCCWREPIVVHRSAEAVQMLDEVKQFVAEGRSEDEIKSIYVARYGARILADPPGNDRYWLYMIPFALFCSLMVIAVARLRSLVAQTPTPRPFVPAELIAQVRMETENDWS
jgi:cytochrome c-type biogenesis protein CcmH